MSLLRSPTRAVSAIRQHVWMVGDVTRGEFAAPLRWLQRHAFTSVFSDLQQASQMASDRHPNLILLAASYPGQFCESDVAPLRIAMPNSPWVYLYSDWCEGETRTGKPLPEMTRIHVTHFWGRVVGTWPTSASRETEKEPVGAASSATRLPTAESPAATVVLATASPRSAEQLAIHLSAAGHSCRHLEEHPAGAPGDVVIWDDGWDVRRPPPQIADVSYRIPLTPIIALINAPRCSDSASLQQLGVVDVIAKPFALSDLAAVVSLLAS